MKKLKKPKKPLTPLQKSLLIIVGAFILSTKLFGAGTQRHLQISNPQVNVWQTLIYPHSSQALKSHRHENDRVVVALNSGVLKVKNSKGKSHYLKLVKGQAYYLAKDKPGEMHTDENVGSQALKVIVVELKGSKNTQSDFERYH